MIAMAKPAYIAIAEYSPTKPVVIFVPSRKQCAPTASDLLTYCLADDKEDRFLNVDMEELGRHIAHISDPILADFLKHGIGLYHEALDPQDKRIVAALFEANAIQVIIASRVSLALY